MSTPALLTSQDWARRAACRTEDPAIFFAAETEHPHARRVRETHARFICAGCPVSGPCLEYRLSFESQRDGGIWAGCDEDERSALRHAGLKRQQREAQSIQGGLA